MKYTKYLAHIVNTKGLPNFTPEQYKLAMNIISLENRMAGIIRAKRYIPASKHLGQLDLLLYKEGKKLVELTGNIPEKYFWEQLFGQTQNR